nr:MAG TPA: hypothetical protein [Caudoviricetes sp.]
MRDVLRERHLHARYSDRPYQASRERTSRPAILG